MAKGTNQERAEFGDKLTKSMIEHGFVKLVNHSVPLPIVEDTFSQVWFFHLRSRAKFEDAESRADQKVFQAAIRVKETYH